MRWRNLPGALTVAGALVLLQQQLLLHQPPRLLDLNMASASTGPAALRSRFSRPLTTESLERNSSLAPQLQHRWLGDGRNLLLTLEPGQRLETSLQLDLAGEDGQGLRLPTSRWHWDPRPRVLAVVNVQGGEQLQVRQHNGDWTAISPIWPEIPHVLPLGDGSGVAAASRLDNGQLQLWLIPLRQANLHPVGQQAPGKLADPPQRLRRKPVLFAHLSTNRRGDLLIQSGRLEPGSRQSVLLPQTGRSQILPWPASGPIQLLPEGGAAVVPSPDGLHLEALPPLEPRRQTLPGSRDLSSFCPPGRALLLRHWPDFRRSLELVEPGLPPRQLWLGSEALLASACSRQGEQIWALLLLGQARPQLRLLALNRNGQELGHRSLKGWELEPGTGLHWDGATRQLLATLRPLSGGGELPLPAQPVMIDGDSLTLQPLELSVRQAHWLPAG